MLGVDNRSSEQNQRQPSRQNKCNSCESTFEEFTKGDTVIMDANTSGDKQTDVGFKCKSCRKHLEHRLKRKITSEELTKEILLSGQHTLERDWRQIFLMKINRLMWGLNAILARKDL